jgi:hypothetical protein
LVSLKLELLTHSGRRRRRKESSRRGEQEEGGDDDDDAGWSVGPLVLRIRLDGPSIGQLVADAVVVGGGGCGGTFSEKQEEQLPGSPQVVSSCSIIDVRPKSERPGRKEVGGKHTNDDVMMM